MAKNYRFFHASAAKNYKGIMENGLMIRESDSKYSKTTGENRTKYKAVYLYHINNKDIINDMFAVYDEVDVYEVYITAPSKLKGDEDSGEREFFESIEKFGTCAYSGNISTDQMKYIGRFKSVVEYDTKFKKMQQIERQGFESKSDTFKEVTLYDYKDEISETEDSNIESALSVISNYLTNIKKELNTLSDKYQVKKSDYELLTLSDKKIDLLVNIETKRVKYMTVEILKQQVDKYEGIILKKSEDILNKVESILNKITKLIPCEIIKDEIVKAGKAYITYSIKYIGDLLTPSQEAFSFNKSDLDKAIKFNLDILKRISLENHDLFKELLDNCKNDQDKINLIINPINIYTSPGNEPKADIINDIKESERIIFSEHFYLPYKMKVVDDDGSVYPILSAKKLTGYHSYIRRNQQIALKEAKSATSTSTSDVLGSAAGSDKVGTFSDPEWTNMIQHNCYNIIKELCGPASVNINQKREFKDALINKGEVSLNELTDDIHYKRHLLMLDQTLKMMGIDSDLIKYPEL